MTKESNQRFIIISTLAAIALILGIPTTYKVIKRHNDRLYKVVEKKVMEAAEKCWNEEVCKENKITLKDLYDNKYLEKQVNPVSKKVYDLDSTIVRKDNKIKLNLK